MDTKKIALMVKEQVGRKTVTFVPENGSTRNYKIESCEVEQRDSDTFLIKLMIENGYLEITLNTASIKAFDIKKARAGGWLCDRKLTFSDSLDGHCYVTT